MIKVRVHLDGNQFGCLNYTCKESVDEYRSFIKSPANIIMLTEIDSEAIITIPTDKYVIEAWEIDE